MLFSVIYTIDIVKGSCVFGDAKWLNDLKPPKYKRRWELTEYYDEFCNDNLTVRRRKYCALLDKKEFLEFVAHCNLYFEDVETMGSVGAPGFDFSWCPAFSFSSYYSDMDISQNAYVTPIPEVNKRSGFDYADWKRLKKALNNMLGY